MTKPLLATRLAAIGTVAPLASIGLTLLDHPHNGPNNLLWIVIWCIATVGLVCAVAALRLGIVQKRWRVVAVALLDLPLAALAFLAGLLADSATNFYV